MSDEKQKKNVIFRRIGGRVIPITVGAGLIASGQKLGSAEVHEKIFKWGHSSKRRTGLAQKPDYYSNETKFTKRMSLKYKDALKAANVKSVVADHHMIPWGQRRTALLNMVFPDKVENHILMASPSRFDFLHELGHAEMRVGKKLSPLAKLNESGKKFRDFDESKHFSWSWIMRKSEPNSLKRKILISKTATKTSQFVGKQVRAIGHAATLGEEVGAWAKGFKHLRTNRQKMAFAKASLKPLATYAAYPVNQLGKVGLIGAGIAAIAYGLRNKNRKD